MFSGKEIKKILFTQYTDPYTEGTGEEALHDFIDHYDVTLDELRDIVGWLKQHEIDMSNWQIPEESIFKLLERDIADGKISLHRVDEYIEYFQIELPYRIAKIYQFLDKQSCSIDSTRDISYPKKGHQHIYRRLELTPVELFAKQYPIFFAPFHGYCVFLDDFQTMVKTDKLSEPQKKEILDFFEYNNVEIIENKTEYIQNTIDDLLFDDRYIRKQKLDDTFTEFKLSMKEKKQYLKYAKEKYDVLDIDRGYRKIVRNMEYLNKIFSFDISVNRYMIKEFVERLNDDPAFKRINEDPVKYYELECRYISLEFYAKMVVTRLIYSSIEEIYCTKMSTVHLIEMVEDLCLNEDELTDYIEIFQEYFEHKKKKYDYELPQGCKCITYVLCDLIRNNSLFDKQTREKIVSSFHKYASTLSFEKFSGVFPQMIENVQSSGNGEENKGDDFVRKLIDIVSEVLLTIR